MTMFGNRAVVAWSGIPHDDGSILHMDGESIEGLFGPGGAYAEGDSIGCTASPLFGCSGMLKGISIWEGEINDQGGNPHETGFIATGLYRRPTLGELACIVEGVSPWAKRVGNGIFSEIQDRLTLSAFVRADFNADQASRAVMIARGVIEQVETEY
jgi:hypothetical protein